VVQEAKKKCCKGQLCNNLRFILRSKNTHHKEVDRKTRDNLLQTHCKSKYLKSNNIQTC
jgi:hypothetical protein